MKILYISNSLDLNDGWGVVAHRTVEESIKVGNVPFVVLENGKSCPFENVKSISILPPVGTFSRNLFSFHKLASYFNKIIETEKIDIVHILVEPYFFYFIYSLINKKKKVKFIMTLHGTYSTAISKGFTKKLVSRIFFSKIDSFVSVSEYTAKRFEVFWNNLFKSSVASLGVSAEKVIDERVNHEDKSLGFTFVGEIKERKGALVAIKAVESIVKEFPSVVLYFIGRNHSQFAEYCKNYVIKKSLEHNVIFLGFLKDQKAVEEVYDKSLANLLPSINTQNGAFEGFGLIHLEANARGIPSVGSYNCGNESAIIDGKTGFLVEQGDQLQLAEKMKYLIERYKTIEYEQMCNNSIRYARQKSWTEYYSKLKVFYG